MLLLRGNHCQSFGALHSDEREMSKAVQLSDLAKSKVWVCWVNFVLPYSSEYWCGWYLARHAKLLICHHQHQVWFEDVSATGVYHNEVSFEGPSISYRISMVNRSILCCSRRLHLQSVVYIYIYKRILLFGLDFFVI